MKVTKRVQKYIEDKVNERYKNYCAEEEKAYNEYCENVRQFIEEIRTKFNNEMREKFPELYLNPDNDRWYRGVTIDIYYSAQFTEVSKKFNAKKDEKNRLINNTVNNILVKMELGGTKEDLDKMLEEM